jgi:hypothetical protein
VEVGGEIVVEGLIRYNDWSGFLLPAPDEIGESKICGQKYKMKLNEGWKLSKDLNIWKLVNK